MPVYNASIWLEPCLDSIIAQTYTNWELLAVDDFSTDNSWNILKKYTKKDIRIRSFQNTQKGIIPALRLAYENSTGDLITRMDADDLMAAHKLDLLVRILTKKGRGFLATGLVKYISDTGVNEGYRQYEQWLNQLTQTATNFTAIYKECVIPSPCWMTWRMDFEACGGFNSERYPEDYDLCFRFYQYQLTVIGINEILHYWRDHPQRTSRNDKTYANQAYFELKIYYFLQLEYDNTKPLVVWGAGKKGKQLAQLLVAKNISFEWVCNTPTKWGHQVYGQIWQSPKYLTQKKDTQVLVAVADPKGKLEIEHFLNKQAQLARYWMLF